VSAPRLAPGEILPLVRRLDGAPDPLALYAALTEGGRRADTMLLESADSAAGIGQRSLVVARCMLRLTCRGRAVDATALSPNGAALRGRLGLRNSEAPGPHLDDRARLLAPGPLDALREAVLEPTLVSDAGPFSHLAAGIFGYDLVDSVESLPAPQSDPERFPDFTFGVPDRSILVDHEHGTCTVVALVAGGADVRTAYNDAARDVERLARVARETGEISSTRAHTMLPARGARSLAAADLDDQAYAALVRKLRGHVEAGDVFQVVPSRAFTVPCEDPLRAYARLRASNPTPYQFFIRSPEFVLFGASPETAIRVGARPARVTMRPIAGTVPRARKPGGEIDAETDSRLQAALLTSPKELAEHLMLVDLARNDVARVSRPGTRIVTRLLALESYRHVSHLVSEVTGDLDEGLDALHAYAASMNMGTLVGAPKIRAAQLLRLHEPAKRGAYGGAVAILTHDGALDSAIVIRSALVSRGVASVRAGAGVVLDSDPLSEAAETRHKAAAVLDALGAEIAA